MATDSPASSAAAVTREELTQRTRALIPVLRERARATEDARRVDSTLDDLRDSGLLQAANPSQHIQRIHRDAPALSHRDGFILDLAGESWGKQLLTADAPLQP